MIKPVVCESHLFFFLKDQSPPGVKKSGNKSTGKENMQNNNKLELTGNNLVRSLDILANKLEHLFTKNSGDFYTFFPWTF